MALMTILLHAAGRTWYDRHVLNKEIRAIWTYNSPSVARQLPNPAADAVWDEWGLARVVPISREDIVKLGKDPRTAVKLDDSVWHLGDETYAAQLDVYHQLHCLNTLRKIAYGTYYNVSTLDPAPTKLTMENIHVNHCIDILMQALQCSGNVNLITLHWVEALPDPFPDMSINRQCINFDKLTSWREANALDIPRYVDTMIKPAGVLEKLMVDAGFEFVGRKSPHPEIDVPNGSI